MGILETLETMPWILILSSGLAFILAFALFLKTIGQDEHKDEVNPKFEVASFNVRIEKLKAKLNESSANQPFGNIPNLSSSTEPTRYSLLQTFKDRPLEAENALADQINKFNGALQQWCSELGKHLASTELEKYQTALERLENKVKTQFYSEDHHDFDRQAFNAMSLVLSITDSDIGRQKNPKKWGQLDALIRQLATSAELVLIDPKVGEIYDSRKHRPAHSTGSVSPASKGGKPKIIQVFTRGLDKKNNPRNEDALLPAEVDVRY